MRAASRSQAISGRNPVAMLCRPALAVAVASRFSVSPSYLASTPSTSTVPLQRRSVSHDSKLNEGFSSQHSASGSTYQDPSKVEAAVGQYLPHLTSLYRRVRGREDPKTNALPAETTAAPLETFRRALAQGQAYALGEPYREIARLASYGEPLSLTSAEIHRAIALLAQAGDPDTQRDLIEDMVDDFQTLFGEPPSADDHRALMSLLARTSDPRAAFPRLEAIPAEIELATSDFNVVLAGLARVGDDEALRSAMDQLETLELKADRRTYHLLLEGLCIAASHRASSPTTAFSFEEPSSASATTSNSPAVTSSTIPNDSLATDAGLPPASSSSLFKSDVTPPGHQHKVDLDFLASETNEVLQQMTAAGVPPMSATYAVLARGHRRLGDTDGSRSYTAKVRSALRNELHKTPQPSELALFDAEDAVASWNTLVLGAAESTMGGGLERAFEEVRDMQLARVEPDEGTVDALLPAVLGASGGGVRSLEDVRRVADLLEEATNVELFGRHWAALVDHVLHAGEMGLGGAPATIASQLEARKTYEEAKRRGVLPDAALVLPLMRSYTVEPECPGEISYAKAFDLYTDLLTAESAAANAQLTTVSRVDSSSSSSDIALTLPTSPLDVLTRGLGPTVPVYDALLHGLAADGALDDPRPKLFPLCKDMKARGLFFPPSTTVHHIKTFMLVADHHKDAFDVYNAFIELHPDSLVEDVDAFLSVVRRFIYTKYPNSYLTSPKNVFEMIKDLRRAGHERSHDIMTTLLSQYARTRMDDEYFDVTSRSDGKDHVEQSFREYAIFVEQAIAWCRIDPFIPIDVTLTNLFMVNSARTNRRQAYHLAWRTVSDETVDPELAMNNDSVNIYMDAHWIAGGATEQVAFVWQWLRNGSFPLTLENWHAYLTALISKGAIYHALQEVCVTMRQGLGDPPAPYPTEETLRIVLHWTRGPEQLGRNFLDHHKTAAEMELMKHFPDLWPAVRDTKPKDLVDVRLSDQHRGLMDRIYGPYDAIEGYAHPSRNISKKTGRHLSDGRKLARVLRLEKEMSLTDVKGLIESMPYWEDAIIEEGPDGKSVVRVVEGRDGREYIRPSWDTRFVE